MKTVSSKIRIFFVFLVAAAFLLSAACWRRRFPGRRYVFVFPSSDGGRFCAEARFLPQEPDADAVRRYADELALGPLSERCRPIFCAGTRVLSCFQRGRVLYADLSAEMLQDDPESADFREQIRLFRKNLLRNFRSVRAVELSVAGRPVFAGDENK